VTGLILGTAQFGAGYGITNSVGRLDDATVTGILAMAYESGIDLFDTAPDYGDAQSRIAVLRPGGVAGRYVSKFGLPEGDLARDGSSDLFEASLAALDVRSLYGLLFHRVGDLRDTRATAAWEHLRAARAEGRVSRIGASIYDLDDLAVVVERFPDLNLLQVPGNIVDRRLLDHPVLRELHDRGVEIHVRSAYLQGLLLTAPAAVPEQLAGLKPAIASLVSAASSSGTSVLEIVLGFLKNHEVVDAVLVGALSAAELRDTVAAWNRIPATVADVEVPAVDDELLDPRRWPARSGS
jgi:aryl-alcohol dehydrogenase-like predicted oxidoreductase